MNENNILEVIKSDKYLNELSRIFPELEIKPDYTQDIHYHYYHSDIKAPEYAEQCHLLHQIYSNGYVFARYDKNLIGVYINPNGYDYYFLTDQDGEVCFIGDSVSNWTYDLLEENKRCREFQAFCLKEFGVKERLKGSIMLNPKTIKLEYNENVYLNDADYMAFRNSFLEYDLYYHLLKNAQENMENQIVLNVLVEGYCREGKELVICMYGINNNNEVLERGTLPSKLFKNLTDADLKENKYIDIYISYHLKNKQIIPISVTAKKVSKVKTFFSEFSNKKKSFRLNYLFAYFLSKVIVFLIELGFKLKK